VAPGSDDENGGDDDDEWGDQPSDADDGREAETKHVIRSSAVPARAAEEKSGEGSTDNSGGGAPDGVPQEFWEKMEELKRQEIETALEEWLEFNEGVSKRGGVRSMNTVLLV